jgi:phospholipid/cholesterol/gamma-HCH transport system ATP-binding protein
MDLFLNFLIDELCYSILNQEDRQVRVRRVKKPERIFLSFEKNIILELKNVSLDFGRKPLFKNLNLRVLKDECTVLIGPSGQGKTTLLKLLAGLVSPNNGTVEVHGASWAKMNDAERFKQLKSMGMLFQKNALFDSMNNSENIAFPLREASDLSESDISAKVKKGLEDVGLAEAIELYPSEISGGMQKRLGIARALALEPEILLYDDPTAGLDPITSRKIAELILKMKSEHQSTIVVTTNDMSRAYQLADQIVFVSEDQVVATGSPAETKKFPDQQVQNFIRGLNI